MPRLKELWDCEICGKAHGDKADAIKCEKIHIQVDQFYAEYEYEGKYPAWVDVEFKDGTSQRYKI